MPDVLGTCLYMIQHIPANIISQLFKTNNGNILTAAKWKRLIIPNYFHTADFLKVNGFKTKCNSISLVMNVEYLTFEQYNQCPQVQGNQLEDLMFLLAAVTSKGKCNE